MQLAICCCLLGVATEVDAGVTEVGAELMAMSALELECEGGKL